MHHFNSQNIYFNTLTALLISIYLNVCFGSLADIQIYALSHRLSLCPNLYLDIMRLALVPNLHPICEWLRLHCADVYTNLHISIELTQNELSSIIYGLQKIHS